VASYSEVGALRATPELLAERACRVFNAANAVLVLDGPPPADLRLGLPAGEYLPPAPATPVPRRFPAAYRDEGGLTMTGVVSRTHEATFLPGVLERAVHDGLRERLGGAYAPWASMTEADDQHVVVGCGADVTPEILSTMAGAGLDVVRRLAEDGVPRAWVEDAVQQRVARLDLPGAAGDVALESAYDVLSDRVPRSPQELLEQVRTTNPQLVDTALRELQATMLVGLPEDARLPRSLRLVTFPEVEPAGAVKRHVHVNWPADRSTFSVDRQLAEVVSGTTARAMPMSEVVGLFSWRDGTRRLVGRDGSVLEMEARQWTNGERLAAALDDAVPAGLHLPMPDREVTFRRMGLAERCAIGFARSANTKPGLLAFVTIALVLTIWSVVGGHKLLAFALLALAASLGAQLWRLEGGQLGTPGSAVTPRSPDPA
jgi:hypothetical protein